MTGPYTHILTTLQNTFGITSLTLLQEQAYQLILAGNNVQIISHTGSGKTLAFLLPVTTGLESGNKAVIIGPSRELIQQIAGISRKLTSKCHAIFSCHGGTDTHAEEERLKSMDPDLTLATPGRLIDHLHRHPEKFKNTGIMVIDEFDKCLSFGFEEELHQLFQALRPRQIILTSATSSETLPPWLPQHFIEITADKEGATSPDVIPMFAFYQTPDQQVDLLLRALAHFNFAKCLIFVNHHDKVGDVVQQLTRAGLCALPYHGDLPQERRERAVFELHNHCCHVLVCTDLAARGLDIPDLELVIEYDPALTSTIYTHRKGRTGRWKRQGVCLTLVHSCNPPSYIENGKDLTEILTATPIPRSIPATPYVAYYIGKGKKHKIGKTDVVGALCKQLHFNAAEIGCITLFSEHVIVAIRSDSVILHALPKKVALRIKNTRTLLQKARS